MNEPYRILIIDDNADIHQDFRRFLVSDDSIAGQLAKAEAEAQGKPVQDIELPHFELDCVFQGQDGLERVISARQSNRPYAVAFVDIRMPPGWDGIETIAHLWKADPALEIVICTAYSDYSARDIACKLRRTHQLLLLKKPFDNIEVQQLALSLGE